MLPLEKQCCSLEYAKKLADLGVKQCAFWSWYETTDYDDTPRLDRADEQGVLPKQNFERKYSAFNVAELGVMLPSEVAGYPSSRQYKDDDGSFVCLYESYARSRWIIFRSDCEADARAKMLIHLLEKKLITVSEINERI